MTDFEGRAVAVIGLAGRFPGAENIDEFWTNLKAGRESIMIFGAEELQRAGVPPEVFQAKGYVAAKGVLADPDGFDAPFFDYTAADAEMLDPQHRLFLECAWLGLEDSGYGEVASDRRVGVFGSVGFNTYLALQLIEDPGLLHAGEQFAVLVSNDKDFLASRVAQKLRLRGPAVVVQSACSSSLLAVHAACQSLLTGECDMAIAGGVSVTFPVANGYRWQEGGIHSRDGHCRSFDADASGFVPGNGAGIVVLKRLPDARRDGDAIYAAIRGSAANNDGGRGVGYTAPSIEGQTEVISEALTFAGILARDIGYVEAHGAATPIGDLIEVAALTRAFEGGKYGTAYCAIGSVKTNVGHLDAAAGVTGLIKTVLALHHELIPASLNVARPNPKISFESTPFYVADRAIEWPRGARLRAAGVNSLGIGGTNVHVVLTEAPMQSARRPGHTCQVLPVSARTPAALSAVKIRLAGRLENDPNVELADAAFTLATGRRAFEYRDFVVACSPADAITKLHESSTKPAAARRVTVGRDIAFLFPGGGAQYPAMGQGLYQSISAFRDHVDQCAALPDRQGSIDLRALLYGRIDRAASSLDDPASALPCIFVTEYALARTLCEWGIEPRALLGHSLGEYVAACLAGTMSLESALRLVMLRGRLMAELGDGAMLSVRLDASRLQALMGGGLMLAAVNGRNSCVVSGPAHEIGAFAHRLAEMAINHTMVPIAVAAHSPLVEPMLDRFAAEVETIDLCPPGIPIISNFTGDWLSDEDAVSVDYWVNHLRHTVRFSDGLARLSAAGDPVLLEVGPGHALAHLVMLDNARRPSDVMTSMRSANVADGSDVGALLAAVGWAWARGVAVDWKRVLGQSGRRLHLPSYPFERERHNRLPARPANLDRGPVRRTAERKSGQVELEAAPSAASIEPCLQRLFARLLGVAAESISTKQRFAEMGMDSLFYVRASQAIEDEFGAIVPFRLMLAELATIERTAAWITSQVQVPRPALTETANATSFDAFRAVAAPHRTHSTGDELAPPVAASRFPFAPGRTTMRLSETQRRRIEEICRRVAAKTSRSKAAAEASRPVLADNRSSAGFNPIWKEMIYPIIAETASGSRMVDLDGNSYVDIAMGFGVHLFGHSAPFINAALRDQFDRGIQLGPQSAMAAEVAHLIADLTGVERVVFANSGTEAVMTALRLSRLATRRSKVVVFDGSYHGFYDGTLGRMSAEHSHAIPATLGVTHGAVQDLMVLPYDDEDSLRAIADAGKEVAAILVEPVQSRRPDLQPRHFLHRLRAVADAIGAVLIFDEVVTGFRVHIGGAQAYFDVRADLVVYGKILGGGMPIGAVAGRREIMDGIDGGAWHFGNDSYPKSDQTFFAGTFCKHPLSMAAAKAVLEHLRREGPVLQSALNTLAAEFAGMVNRRLQSHGDYYRIAHFGSLFRILPTHRNTLGELLFFLLLERGVFTWEGRTCFLSTAHSDRDVQLVADAIGDAAERVELLHRCADEGHPAVVDLGSRQEIRAEASTAAVFPLTAGQRDIWAQVQGNDEASRAYNESMVLRLDGSLDVSAVERAIALLVARHESLRTVVAPSGREQAVRREMPVGLSVADFSGLDDPDSEAETWIRAEAAKRFDLQRGPLLRCSLGRLSSCRHMLVLTMHHLVGDGYSSMVLLREGGHAYSELVSNRMPALPQPAQYSAYADRLYRRSAERHAADVRYWLGILQDPPPSLQLTTDFPRPMVRSYRGDHATVLLDADCVAALQSMSRRIGVRFVSVLLSAYSLLLHHLAATADLLIGVPSAGQIQHGLFDLVGYCLNMMPFRSKLDRDATGHDLISRTDRLVAACYDHQLDSLGDVARALKISRTSGHAPLFDTIFNLDRMPGADVDFAGLRLVARENHSGGAKYDVIWNVTEDHQGLIVDCVFNASLFRPTTVQSWLKRFSLLCVLLADSELRVSALLASLERMRDDDRQVRAHARRSSAAARLVEATRKPCDLGKVQHD
jgi:acyl transferase domain-containing protein/glutamate-1-semialdehyde aminotransferase